MAARPPQIAAQTPSELLLLAVLTEIRGLREDQNEHFRLLRLALEQDRRPLSILSRADRGLLAQLLPAIGGVLGSDLFLVRDLFEADASALRVALGALTRKQVGRLLRRGEGQPVDNYLVERQGTETHATLWRVVQVPEFLNGRNLPVSPAPSRGGLE